MRVIPNNFLGFFKTVAGVKLESGEALPTVKLTKDAQPKMSYSTSAICPEFCVRYQECSCNGI